MPETRPFDLRAAIDAAKPGDVIEVPPGFVCAGPITLRPREPGQPPAWLVVRGATDLPPGTRP